MSGYSCPSCGRKAKLPDYCCGSSMLRQGSFYCDTCKAHSNKADICCSSPMRQI
ncbi:MAG: hypothetical protein RBT41_09190 [Clostridia bacterium]|nr:hypothetical protein [Clostridia bacterium]